MEKNKDKVLITEKRIGIPPDYQYKALRSSNFIQSNWHSNKLVIVKEIMSINKDSEILDMGTGSGIFELSFWDKVKRIVGIDYNDEALDFLSSKLEERNIKNVELHQCDIRNLASLGNLGKFDIILIMDVIEHIRIEEATKTVKYLKNFLKENGIVYVITPNYKSLWRFIEVVLDKISFLPKLEDEQHLAKYHRRNLCQLFANEGFKTEKFYSFNLFSFLFPTKVLASFFCKLELSCPFSMGNLILGVFKLEKGTESSSNPNTTN